MSDLKSKLANATLPERIVPICFRGDLQARFQEIEQRLIAADERPGNPADSTRLTGPKPERLLLAEELEAVREEMRANSVNFTLRSMPSGAWRALKAAHPIPDEGATAIDDSFGANVKTFFNVAVRKSIVDPVPDDDDWEQMTDPDAGILSDAEWAKLVDATYALNEDQVSIPFSSRGFGILSMHSDESDSPAPSE